MNLGRQMQKEAGSSMKITGRRRAGVEKHVVTGGVMWEVKRMKIFYFFILF